jgi:hypothetical protein
MAVDNNIFEPAFNFEDAETTVLLNEIHPQVSIDGISYTGNGEVHLALLPRASICLHGSFQGIPSDNLLMIAGGLKEIPYLSINNRQIEGFLVEVGGDLASEEMTFKWIPKSEPVDRMGDESTELKWVLFHLFNFTELMGTRRSSEQYGTRTQQIEHVDLSCGEWKVELKSLVATKDNFRVLKAQGGYRLTHIVCFEKEDGSTFSGKNACELLEGLRFFLSFAKGNWCEPICPVGFDASGNRAWESWSSPREPWHTSVSWFDPHHSLQLGTLFPGFMKRWQDDDWREALREILYWYVNANNSSRGIDAGIILTQAAIERLSYEYSVRYRRLLTVNGFKDLWASDKFRLLLSSMKIPLDIPGESSELQQLAGNSQMNWLDAPHALTEIRNSLVHPEHKRRGQLSVAYYEAWNMSLWYLEMGILALCGYSGSCRNRLKHRWVGQTENVPWG